GLREIAWQMIGGSSSLGRLKAGPTYSSFDDGVAVPCSGKTTGALSNVLSRWPRERQPDAIVPAAVHAERAADDEDDPLFHRLGEQRLTFIALRQLRPEEEPALRLNPRHAIAEPLAQA